MLLAVSKKIACKYLCIQFAFTNRHHKQLIHHISGLYVFGCAHTPASTNSLVQENALHAWIANCNRYTSSSHSCVSNESLLPSHLFTTDPYKSQGNLNRCDGFLYSRQLKNTDLARHQLRFFLPSYLTAKPLASNVSARFFPSA